MKIFKFLILSILLTGCAAYKSLSPDSEQMVMSTLWYQHSAEMRAIYYQSFSLARLRVEQALSNAGLEKPPAVVVDIDETILDNSPSEARNILEGERYSPQRWSDWTAGASAEPLPGSLEFARFLEDSGVELFYISNRTVDELGVTIENLEKYGFPYADTAHLLLKDVSSGKKARREKVEKSHEIILLIGDNLDDFSEIFEDRSALYGKPIVDSLRQEFGKRYIILPNPMYGSWTSGLYGSTSKLSPKEVAELRRKYLSGY